jgi:hypothetical protein
VDTAVDVQLVNNANRLLARYQLGNFNGQLFPDPSTITKPMELIGAVPDNDIGGTFIRISISPIGHDSWWFDWWLTYTWSGLEQRQTAPVTGWGLSQDTLSATAPVNIAP